MQTRRHNLPYVCVLINDCKVLDTSAAKAKVMKVVTVLIICT